MINVNSNNIESVMMLVRKILINKKIISNVSTVRYWDDHTTKPILDIDLMEILNYKILKNKTSFSDEEIGKFLLEIILHEDPKLKGVDVWFGKGDKNSKLFLLTI